MQWITIFFGAYVCWKIIWRATFTLDNFAFPYKLHTYLSNALRVVSDGGPLIIIDKLGQSIKEFFVFHHKTFSFIFPLLRNDDVQLQPVDACNPGRAINTSVANTGFVSLYRRGL